MKVGSQSEASHLENQLEKPGGQKSRLAIIFLTVFIDLVGFGIIIPLGPFLGQKFNASNLEIGLLMSIYSLMQFIFSPMWGTLSDRFGRRPIILVSLLGSSLSYLLFAFSNSLALLFVARGLAGVFGGNISAAHAAIADLTPPENRSKNMGLIGAAFGLGFIFGPAIGAGLGVLGTQLGSEPPFGISFSALGASLICFLNFVGAIYFLKESLPKEHRAKHLHFRRSRFKELGRHLTRPVAGPLMIVYFLSGLAMAQMESMLFIFVDEKFAWGFQKASMGFAYIGVLMVLTQGVFIRRWMPKYGERKLLLTGLALFALSLAAIPVSVSIWLLAITMTAFALGNGLMRPPNLGLISLASEASEQGAVMGVTNSLAALGRILGPAAGGYLYSAYGSSAPFFISALLGAVAWWLALRESRFIKSDAGAVKTTVVSEEKRDAHV